MLLLTFQLWLLVIVILIDKSCIGLASQWPVKCWPNLYFCNNWLSSQQWPQFSFLSQLGFVKTVLNVCFLFSSFSFARLLTLNLSVNCKCYSTFPCLRFNKLCSATLIHLVLAQLCGSVNITEMLKLQKNSNLVCFFYFCPCYKINKLLKTMYKCVSE